MKQDDHVDIPEEQDSPAVATEESHVALIVFIVLAIAVILVIIFYFAFFAKLHKNQPIQKEATVMPTISQIQQAALQDKNSEVTKDTTIAKTLDVPPLYSKTIWKDITNATQAANLNTLFVDNSDVSIQLKGHYWEGEISHDTTFELNSYYANELEKNGWFPPGGIDSLHFATFTLSPLSAGGACSNIEGFLGYKDGLVRSVVILSNILPCNPDGSGSQRISTDYTIFISDPISLKDISAALNNR